MKRWTLRQARTRRKLSQEQLAAASGVKQGVISRLETGVIVNPRFAIVVKLANALDIPPEHLAFGQRDEARA